jgi:di/tricarboxylate transporter
MAIMNELFSYLGVSYELVITLAIILLGIFLFVKEYFTIDTTSILIMSLFIVSAVLSPQEGFSGFINTATITVACLFVLSFAVFKSGLLNPIIKLLTVLGRIHYFFALLFIILVSGLFSAFINDTAVVALLMPVVLQMAKSLNIPAGRLLMPLSFGALLGGVCTLIGTSTNILVSGITESYGLEPFSMFEFTKPAIILTLAGVLYMITIGALLLPGRKSENA